jgi:hypothetical protein
MKKTIIAVIFSSLFGSAFAQSGESKTSVEINIFGNGDKRSTDSLKHVSKAPGFNAGFTFARFDLGLTTLIDNGSFTLSPQNEFLKYKTIKSNNVGFDIVQVGYRFNSAFKVNLSGGFDWNLIRLQEDVTILQKTTPLDYRMDSIQYSKNRFSSVYLRIPLAFDFRTKEDDSGNKFHIVVGPEAGFLLNGRVKQKSAELGKRKFDDDYNFAKFRYGAYARVGYSALGVYAKYYFNDMFENSPDQKGLKTFAFGLMLGF